MYKEAIRKKLRFDSKFGPLTVEQLWDLKRNQLKELIKSIYEKKEELGQIKEDLEFLENNGTDADESKESHLINLKFNILKDIWETKCKESKEISENEIKRSEINHLKEILAEKEEKNLRELSEEELLQKIKELEGNN